MAGRPAPRGRRLGAARRAPQPAAAPDLRPRPRREADDVTAGVVLSTGGRDDLPEVMAVMSDSFDPRFGEAWTMNQCAGLLPLPGVWLTLARQEDGVFGFSLARLVA